LPRYEYKCKTCGKTFEAVHGVNDKIEECQFCGKEVRRVFHPIGIVFKGSGFYATDSRRPDNRPYKSESDKKEETDKPAEKTEKTENKEKDAKPKDPAKKS
jgi:putative FmdB family regulatory protein